jgi:pimeloyl-ACP methyl ester carboxylesterase
VGTVAPLSLGWIVRAVLVALPFKYFSKKFVKWLARDIYDDGKRGCLLIEEHIDETYIAVRSFKSKKLVNPAVLTDEELNRIGGDVLLVIGENEKIYSPKEVIDRIRCVAPKIETKLVKNAGHDLTMAKPDEINQVIVSFLGGSVL